MAVTRTLVDTDRVQIIQNKWLDDVRQYQQDWDTLHKHGTINALLTNVGIGTNTTITVSENTAVNANTDLTSYPNIKWHFVGTGKLTPAAGITLTLYSPNTITCDPSKQCLDATNGTIVFAQPGTVYAGWFGAKPATQSVTHVQKAHDSLPSTGGEVVMTGNYLFNDSLDITKDKFTLRGQGMSTTKITSTAIGVPTIYCNTEAVFLTFKDFWLSGNGLTGGSGCGHGIAMIDPTPDTGSYAPQQCLVENVRIDGFKGADSDGRGGSMLACGVAQVSTLTNTFRRCYIDSCAIGFYADTCFTPRLYDSSVLSCTKYGVMILGATGPTENFFMHGCDILNNGDGGTYAQTGWATAPTGNVFIYNGEGIDLTGNKVKNGSLANYMLHFCNGVKFGGNHIRADHKYGAYVRNCNAIAFDGVNFDVSTGSTNNGKYLTIEMTDGNNSRAITVRSCRFRAQAGKNADEMINIRGDNAARELVGFEINANYFGHTSVASACTVTYGIFVETCTLKAGSLSRNAFYAPTNLTFTYGMHGNAASTLDASVDVLDNEYTTAGGTISTTEQFL